MSERRYFIVKAVEIEDDQITADCPTGWSGTPDIGRGCYVVMHPSWDPGAPVLNEDVTTDDLKGLDDEALHAQLPIEIKAGVTDEQINELADDLGFQAIPVERLLRCRVGGV